jgi:hypothetical protein
LKLSEVAEALIYLHDLEIVHGCFKGYAFELAVTVYMAYLDPRWEY